MKSYFLSPIKSRSAAAAALSTTLPGATDPWLLKDSGGDVIAYFSLVEADDTTGMRTVQADVSGRHYNRDADVIAVLEKLRESAGGEVTNDA
jgi:hypothetical protein